MQRIRRLVWVGVGLLLFGCAGGGAGSPSAGDGGATGENRDGTADGAVDVGKELPPETTADHVADADAGEEPACERPGTRWERGVAAFREVTEEWGLLGVQATRLSVTDLDRDGWPDLLVRHGGGPDDFAEGGERRRWLMRNAEGEGFVDVTAASGIFTPRHIADPDYGRPGEVVATGDVDNDGDLDIYVGLRRIDISDPEAETGELMLNDGDGKFSLGPEQSAARFPWVASTPGGISFVDYDRDGWLDLWTVHSELPGLIPVQDHLLRGDGAGAFTNVTALVGLTTRTWKFVEDLNAARANSWGWGAAACDLNGDGLPELLASSYGRAPNHLWLGTGEAGGEVRFDNLSIASGYAFDHRTDWTDNLSAQCYCADNPDAEDCDLAPPPASPAICEGLAASFGPGYRWNHDSSREPFSLGGVTGTTVCADVDNDGDLDLVNHEIVHSDVGSSSDPTELLVNTGEALPRFERPGQEATGLTRVDTTAYWDHGDMTGAVFDFDNDGWPDVYIGASDYPGNKALLYHQEAPLEFVRLEVAEYFEHTRAHGVTVADFDRDGDLDIAVGQSRMRCDGALGADCGPDSQMRLFENLMGGPVSNWLQLRLEGGEGSNRAAIGARVTVTAGGVQQTQEVDGGHGHFGLQRDLTLHFGLGPACRAAVRVVWPDAAATEQVFTVEGNARYDVRQGEAPQVAQ